MEQIVMGVVLVMVAVVFLAAIGFGRSEKQSAVQVMPDAVASEKRDLRAQPRWLQKVKADRGGYFWLPCPMCGEEFGGHEWAGHLMRSDHEGTGICANCAAEADRRNRERFPHHYGPNVVRIGLSIKPR